MQATPAMAISNLVKQSVVRNHKSYLRAINLANDYLRNPEDMKRLISDAQTKINDVASQSIEAVGEGLQVLMRMLTAYATGQYRAIPWRTLAVVTAAIVYFVMPLDFIPDLLPVLGLMDDVALIAWTTSQVKVDIDRFLEWEARQQAQASDAALPGAGAPRQHGAAPAPTVGTAAGTSPGSAGQPGPPAGG